jgi:histidyl-tRNA synthetase
MKNIIKSVKGTREFYPHDMALRNWLYENIRQISTLFGYQEYDGPYIESLELYAAKSGEELVKEQSFVFPDRGGNLVALRPELTPSLARLVAQKQRQLNYPLRWWSFGPFWRYEKPQKGRTREFFQWNIDLIGVNTPEADAELVSICAGFFKKVGLTPNHVKILVNDRRLMDQEISALGISAEKKGCVLNLIDRKDKMEPKEWDTYILKEGFDSGHLKGIKRILADKDFYKKSSEMKRFFSAIENLGVRDYVQFDARIVRGLDYYTGIVFEARDAAETGRAILGGGHYDNLVEDVGGDPLPGVGFAMGDVVLPIILEELGKIPAFDVYPAKVLVAIFDESTSAYSHMVSAALRNVSINTILYPDAVKLGRQFKFADRTEIRFVIVAGPEEMESQTVQVKDLSSGEQRSTKLPQAIQWITAELADDIRA